MTFLEIEFPKKPTQWGSCNFGGLQYLHKFFKGSTEGNRLY